MKGIKDLNSSRSRLVIEALVIMLSVLLGFVLNGWRQSMSEQKTVDVALRSIAVEACYNKEELESRLVYYHTLSDTLARLAAEQGLNTTMQLSEVPGFSGIDLPTVRSSSFETIRATGAITNMDFELANTITQAYGYHEDYKRLLEQPVNAFLMGQLDEIGEYGRFYTIIANLGRNLSREYTDLLSVLEKRGVELAPHCIGP